MDINGNISSSLTGLPNITVTDSWIIDGMFGFQITNSNYARNVFDFLTDNYNTSLEYELYLGNDYNLLGSSGNTFERSSDFIYDFNTRYLYERINIFSELGINLSEFNSKIHNHNYLNGTKHYSDQDILTNESFPEINHFVKYNVNSYYPHSPF